MRIADVSDFRLARHLYHLVDHGREIFNAHIEPIIVILCSVLSGIIGRLGVVSFGIPSIRVRVSSSPIVTHPHIIALVNKRKMPGF